MCLLYLMCLLYRLYLLSDGGAHPVAHCGVQHRQKKMAIPIHNRYRHVGVTRLASLGRVSQGQIGLRSSPLSKQRQSL
jgi:hypothetical protein